MNKHQRFLRSKLSSAITLTCLGAAGASMMMPEGLHATTYELSAGEDRTIGSSSSITVANDDGIVAYNVVAGNLAIESGGGIDVEADDSGSYSIAAIRILGSGGSAGAGDLINRGAIDSAIADDVGGWIDALGLAVESDAYGAGNVLVQVNDTINEGTIRADAGAGNTGAYVSGADFFGMVGENATGNATIDAGDVQNSAGATIEASGGAEASGLALGAETEGAGNATIGVGGILNQGDITARDGSEDVIGIALSGETEGAGDAGITADGVTNEGDIAVTVADTVTPGRDGLNAMGIVLGSDAESTGSASARIIGSIANSGAIGVDIHGDGDGYLYYAGGIVLRAGTEGAGDADTTTVGLVNETGASITVDGGAGEGVGMGVYSKTGDWNSPGTETGNATVDMDSLINRGSIDASGDEYAIGIEIASEAFGTGNATLDVGSVLNAGEITASGGAEDTVGIVFYNETEGTGAATMTVDSLSNSGAIRATASVTADLDDLFAGGISFGSESENSGDATATIASIRNAGAIIASIDGVADTGDEMYPVGIEFYAEAGSTGDASAGVGSLLNEGSIFINVDETNHDVIGIGEAIGIDVYAETWDEDGTASVSLDRLTNTGTIVVAGDEFAAGIVVFGEAEGDGTANITIEELTNTSDGTITASGGAWGVRGIELHGEATEGAGAVTIDVATIANAGAITVSDSSSGNVVGMKAGSLISAEDGASVAGGPTTEVTSLTNTGAISSSGGAGFTVGMGVISKLFADGASTITADAASGTSVTDMTNSSTITVDGENGSLYAVGMCARNEISADDGATVNGSSSTAVTNMLNQGAITASGGTMYTVGMGVVSGIRGDQTNYAIGSNVTLGADAASATDIASIINESSITVTGTNIDNANAVGICIKSQTMPGGTADTASATSSVGSITNAGAITANEAAGVTASSTHTAGISIGAESYGNLDATVNVGDGATYSGDVTNTGAITATGSNSVAGIDIASMAMGAGDATTTIGGDISNASGATITSHGHGISLYTSATGAGSAGVTVGGGLTNAGTIQSTGDGYGIYVGAGVTIAEGITNTGVVHGAGDSPYAIYVDNAATVETITLSGDDARLVGDVRAANSALTLSGQSADSWFRTEGAFTVDSFTIGADGALAMADDAHAFTMGTGIFSNQGSLKVLAGVTATITGNYTQSGDGVYVTQIDVDGTTITHGTLAITGVVDLNNTLAVSVTDNAEALLTPDENGATTATITDETVLTYGTRADAGDITVTDNSFLVDFTAVDDGDSIELTATAIESYATALEEAVGATNGVSSDGTEVSEVAAALGSALDADNTDGGLSADAQNLQNIFNNLNTTGGSQAVANGLAEIQEAPVTTAVANVAMDVSGGFSGAMQNRVAAMTTPDGLTGAETGLAAGDFGPDSVWWLKPYGSFADQDDKGNISGYEMESWGLALGLDQDLSPALRGGVALSYAKANVDSSSGRQGVDIDTYQIGVYGTRELGPDSRVNAQAAIGLGKYDSKRTAVGTTYTAEYDSTNLSAGAALEKNYLKTAKSMLRASVSAEYAYVDVDGYTEENADILDLKISGTSQDSLILGVGGEYKYSPSDKGVFSARAGVGYDALADTASVQSQFVSSSGASGTPFTTEGMDPERFLFRGGLGYEYRTGKNTTVDARYDTELRDGYDNHAFSVKFKYSF